MSPEEAPKLTMETPEPLQEMMTPAKDFQTIGGSVDCQWSLSHEETSLVIKESPADIWETETHHQTPRVERGGEKGVVNKGQLLTTWLSPKEDKPSEEAKFEV